MADYNKDDIIETIDESMVEEIPPEPKAPEAPEPNFTESDSREYKSEANTSYSYNNVDSDDEVAKILAIISVITGILSIIMCCSTSIGLVLSVTSAVCGFISIRKSNIVKSVAVVGIGLAGFGLALVITDFIIKLIFNISGSLLSALFSFFGALF